MINLNIDLSDKPDIEVEISLPEIPESHFYKVVDINNKPKLISIPKPHTSSYLTHWYQLEDRVPKIGENIWVLTTDNELCTTLVLSIKDKELISLPHKSIMFWSYGLNPYLGLGVSYEGELEDFLKFITRNSNAIFGYDGTLYEVNVREKEKKDD